jgi:hypothetical protein
MFRGETTGDPNGASWCLQTWQELRILPVRPAGEVSKGVHDND